MPLTLAAPALTYVRWNCRRCGHQGGMARTTVPFDWNQGEAMRAILIDQLRKKLVRVHQKSGCVAVPTDFEVYGASPHGDRA